VVEGWVEVGWVGEGWEGMEGVVRAVVGWGVVGMGVGEVRAKGAEERAAVEAGWVPQDPRCPVQYLSSPQCRRHRVLLGQRGLWVVGAGCGICCWRGAATLGCG
jgi:hypothetical protein